MMLFLETVSKRAIVALSVATLAATALQAQTVIVDNADPGFTVLTGEWSTGTTAPGHWGADYRFRTTTGYGTPIGEVEWRPNLPHAGAYQVAIYYPQGTNRANNAPFTVHHAGGATTFLVNQQQNGGQWNVLGTFTFAAGTAGYVTLSNDANPSVVIADAVSFTAESSTTWLTMTVTPTGAGTTSPPVGGPYAYSFNEVVPIAASPVAGFQFHHWEVSGGAAVADPTTPNTTVTMDQDKTVTAVFVQQGATTGEFRGFWADAFHPGFKSIDEINTMIGWALAGNYNAIVAEVLAFQDTGASGHGAYWNSSLVPRAADIVGGIDPLAELVTRAHAAGLEVHCWLVAFRVSSTWPPNGNPTVAAHPEWLMVPRASMGTVAKVGSYYTFDPGSPGVQEYLASIVRELCTNYGIDGIHWDYIRYTQVDAGYPADPNYSGSSLRRFQAITGYGGVPDPNEPSWCNFRRRTITEVVRRGMTETAASLSVRQPLRHTAALVTWYPANSDFTQTNPYKLFCDWKYWQQMGYLDATIPMCYFDENSYPSTYRAWVNNSVAWAQSYGRHTYIGPGIYMNTFADSRTQLLYARNAGAQGLCTYSYQSTNDGGQPWSDWYPYVAANVFTQPASPPGMPWRDPNLATQGFVYGRVTNGATGTPIDNATIKLNGFVQLQTDGNGCFLLTRLAAGPDGSLLPISAVAPGYTEVARPLVRVMRAGFTEANFALGLWRAGDYDVDGDVDLTDRGRLLPCLTAPDVGPPPPGCDLFDFDSDLDVDLADFAVFHTSFGS